VAFSSVGRCESLDYGSSIAKRYHMFARGHRSPRITDAANKDLQAMMQKGHNALREMEDA